jgi:hypothetical protein
MVVLTKKRQIWQIGGTSVGFPPSDVVWIYEGCIGTAGEAAVAVASDELPTLRSGRIAAPSAFVHRVTDVVVDRQDHRGITGDPTDRLGADEALALELARQFRSFVEQGGQRHVGDDGEGGDCLIWRPRGANRSDERVAKPLIPRGLAV